MGYQEEIDKIDQRLADMDHVQAKMTEQGIGLGEYDLDSLASLRARERVKEEDFAKAQEAEAAKAEQMQLERDQRLLEDPQIGGDSFTQEDPPKIIKPQEEEQAKEDKKVLEFTQEERDRYKKYQQLLTDKLVEEYPDSESFLEQALNTNLAQKRDEVFTGAVRELDPHLKAKQMKEVLGENWDDWVGLKQKIFENEGKEFGKTTRGMKEGDQNIAESFGIQSATHWKANRRTTSEEAKANEAYYESRIAKIKRDEEGNPISNQ